MTSEEFEKAIEKAFGFGSGRDEVELSEETAGERRARLLDYAKLLVENEHEERGALDRACFDLQSSIDASDDLVPTIGSLVAITCRQLEENRSKIQRMVSWLRKVKSKLDDALELAESVLEVEHDAKGNEHESR